MYLAADRFDVPAHVGPRTAARARFRSASSVDLAVAPVVLERKLAVDCHEALAHVDRGVDDGAAGEAVLHLSSSAGGSDLGEGLLEERLAEQCRAASAASGGPRGASRRPRASRSSARPRRSRPIFSPTSVKSLPGLAEVRPRRSFWPSARRRSTSWTRSSTRPRGAPRSGGRPTRTPAAPRPSRRAAGRDGRASRTRRERREHEAISASAGRSRSVSRLPKRSRHDVASRSGHSMSERRRFQEALSPAGARPVPAGDMRE